MARLAAAGSFGRDMPGLDDTARFREWRGWWGCRALAVAPCCHVEWRGSTACSEGSSEEELRWIGWCRHVQRRLRCVVRRWWWRNDTAKMMCPAVVWAKSRHHIWHHLLLPYPCSPPMGLTVLRCLHQDSFWCCAHFRDHRRPSASRKGARDGALAGNIVVVAASSSTSSEARRRRRGTTAGNAGTTAPATSRTACGSPEDPLKLLQETTNVACTEIAWKGGVGSEKTSHSYHVPLVECPSIYEMLPNPHFKWKEAPIVQVWRKNPEKDGIAELVLYEATDCLSLFQEALRNNELKYNGKTIALPFNMAVFKWATETRRILENAKLPDTVSFYNIYGTSYDTPYDVCYGSESSPIGDLSEVCHTMPVYTYVDGDGTVPIESTMADGFAAKERVGIEADHRGLLCDENVFELLKKWLGVKQESTWRRRLSNKSKVMDFVQ